MNWFLIVWQWTIACLHVAQSWKDGIVIPLFKKGDQSKTANYRGITLLAVLGKCFMHILIFRLLWVMDWQLLESQYGFRPHQGRIHGMCVLQRLIESAGTLPEGMYTLYIDLEQAFDRVPRRKLWRCLRKRGLPKAFIKLLHDLYSSNRCRARSEGMLGK
jgi:Reverse transcriptase (RNA-dependent DNA polymerase).